MSNATTMEGVRRFDPYADLRPVADLMCVAFADRLDPAGRLALSQIQRLARRNLLLNWLSLEPAAVPPGFVWEVGGVVVGNVSVRRAPEAGGYLIGNVAVHPDWRRRGIAAALMKAALHEIASQGGRWAGLEVDGDNLVARGMYDHLGFREVGRTVALLRAPGNTPVSIPAVGPPLGMRRAKAGDARALWDLARGSIPAAQRSFFDLRRGSFQPGFERTLTCWLEGVREAWWAVDLGSRLCGAVRTRQEPGRHPNQLDMWVAADCAGQIEPGLVAQGLIGVKGMCAKMIEAVLPERAAWAIAALEECEFRRSYVLVQMGMSVGGNRGVDRLVSDF